jgi:UDP-N-acetylmuramoylalanine--D-glutamate ligase
VVVSGGVIVRRSAGTEQPLVPLSAIKLLGPHLVMDVVAAAAVAALAGVDADAMTRAVEGFTGLEHALEPVVAIGGVRFVNDSKATNVEAALRSIESFGTGVVAIVGGRFKGGDLSVLRAPLEQRGGTVIAIGEARPLIHAALAPHVPVRDAADMDAAVRIAFSSAAPGSVVVLAPACASFDMFRDYAERGRVFKQAALRLEEEWTSAREH